MARPVRNVFVKIGALLLAGVVSAIIVSMTANPGPGNIDIAAAAWGLAIWLGVLTLAFMALVWQLAVQQRDARDSDD